MWQRVLWPASLCYRFGAGVRRAFAKPADVGATVLCVGNVTMGGAGKTPVVIALAKAAAELGIETAVVSRGYGGRLAGPVRVDPARHRAADVGDEPLLLASHVTTWIDRDRARGAAAARREGAALILLDDGFQNPTLQKDFSLLVFDGGYGVGNGAVFPAGPLRETVESALQRADMCLLIGEDRRNLRNTVLKDADVRMARLIPDPAACFDKSKKVVAFAGIGIPKKFFETLRSMGFDLADAKSYPDHHKYKNSDLRYLMQKAKTIDASLITTRKDFVRLPPDYTGGVQVLDVSLECDTPGTFETIVREAMSHG